MTSNFHRVALMLFTLLLSANSSWADSAFGGGDGSARTPYLIATAEHWDQLATNVAAGTSYSNQFFQLDADITVSAMLGTGKASKDAKPFSGTFDGNGHTLTFNHTATAEEGDIAPFRFIKNATIQNLHVDGTINTAYRHAAGLAARTYGTSLIKNCHVSTVIRSSVSGDGTHAGIVVMKPNWDSAKLTIEGCVFDGKILTTNGTTHCAGLVGYTSYGSLTIKNCIYAPAALAEGETAVSSEYTLYRFDANHTGTITVDNCYYFQPLGEPQGKQAFSITFPDGIDIYIIPTGNATEYAVSGITAYNGNPALKYGGVVYAGIGDEVNLNFNHNYVGNNITYRVDSEYGKLTGNDADGYTLKMNDRNVVVGISMTGPALVQLPGSGTEEYPYEIGSKQAWDIFVSYVNNGSQGYATAYYKLTDNISVTTMLGSENHRFKGHFDGDGKTLTVNYDTDEQFAAPFRYVEGAEIKNLRVAGTIKTSNKFAAGFVANTKGNTNISFCQSSVTIDSSVNGDGTHGGFVAYTMDGTLTIMGGVFDGRMLGPKTNCCAGFVGWNETKDGANGKVSIYYSLFAPMSTELVIEKTFVRSRSFDSGVVTLQNCYCTANYNNDQQVHVYSVSAGDGVSITYTPTPTNNSFEFPSAGLYIYDGIGLKYHDVLYVVGGAKQDPRFVPLTLGYDNNALPANCTFTGFAIDNDPDASLIPPQEGEQPYTLAIVQADVVIYATYAVTTTGWSGSGTGVQGDPYIINNVAQWNEFVNKVNVGMGNYATAYYKLGADIAVTTMAGTDGYEFKGHFDGDGRTLTLSYGQQQVPFNENYCAPFRYVQNAHISNLNVSGDIYTRKQFAAGIAGCATGNNIITDCRVSVTIHSSVNGDGTHGGLLAIIQSGTTTIENCAFDGSITGGYTDSCGGFVGWAEADNSVIATFKNCIFAPSSLDISTARCATFARARSNSYFTFNDCYYIRSLRDVQGIQAFTELVANTPSYEKSIAGVSFYVTLPLVSDVTATDITPTSATVGWTAPDQFDCQVRYRIKSEAAVTTLYSTGFEDAAGINGWTTLDCDNDGENWTCSTDQYNGAPHQGTAFFYSQSYLRSVGALSPDNWLISPKLTLDGMLKVWLSGQPGDYYKEHFAIYLSLDGIFVDDNKQPLGTLVTLVPETETTESYNEYVADLSEFKGREGYIGIRHFNTTDQLSLVVDDFGIYRTDYAEWTTLDNVNATGTTITGLQPATTYEYQVVYTYGGKTYYAPIATLTTVNDNLPPTDISVTNITSNASTIGWVASSSSYNLRYRSFTGDYALVTLSVSEDIWEDGSGYQMLLDADADTYGRIIPEEGALSPDGDASEATYKEFAYKIPEQADGALITENMVDGNQVKSITIEIPAGTYDWCITNPTPDDRVWIANDEGNINGRYDDFVFESGKHYTFVVTSCYIGDRVDMTVAERTSDNSSTSEWTTVEGITDTSYTLSGLMPSTSYIVQVQSVKDERLSDWRSTTFTTINPIDIQLANAGDNRQVISDNKGKGCNVTLAGRTLYKDGSWNTLCLPFAVSNFTGTPLEGATVMTLSTSSFAGGELTLEFTGASSIVAGQPYIVKWNDQAAGGVIGGNNGTVTNTYNTGSVDSQGNLVDPVFSNVTISDATANAETTWVDFIGTTSPVSIYEGSDKKTNLYLGSGDKIYYPTRENFTINSCRAYFQLKNDLTAGEPSPSGDTEGGFVRSFTLNFGDSEASGIMDAEANSSPFTLHSSLKEGWYTLDGRRLNGKPTTLGIYVNNGRIINIK